MEAGIPVEEWTNTQAGTRGVSGMLIHQREALLAVKGLVEQQLVRDMAKVAELHEMMARIKHGGGR